MKVVPYRLYLELNGSKKSKDPVGNKIKTYGKYAVVYLNDGYFAVIDQKFVSRIEQFTWCKHKSHNRKDLIYSCTNRSGQSQQKMHTLIMRVPAGYVVDHIDGNGLNNTLQNLRQATPSENGKNINPIKPVFHLDFGIPEWVKTGIQPTKAAS